MPASNTSELAKSFVVGEEVGNSIRAEWDKRKETSIYSRLNTSNLVSLFTEHIEL